MANDRISDEIIRLMDEAFEALRDGQWTIVAERTRAVIALDPDHEEAARLLAAATRMLDDGAEGEAPTAPTEVEPPTPAIVTTTTAPDGPTIPADDPAAPVSAAGVGAGWQLIRRTGRVALALPRPLVAPLIVPLILVVRAFVFAAPAALSASP